MRPHHNRPTFHYPPCRLTSHQFEIGNIGEGLNKCWATAWLQLQMDISAWPPPSAHGLHPAPLSAGMEYMLYELFSGWIGQSLAWTPHSLLAPLPEQHFWLGYAIKLPQPKERQGPVQCTARQLFVSGTNHHHHHHQTTSGSSPPKIS